MVEDSYEMTIGRFLLLSHLQEGVFQEWECQFTKKYQIHHPPSSQNADLDQVISTVMGFQTIITQ